MGNLSFDVTREELVEAFSAAGQVVDAKIPTDRETGRPRGFAFVEFPDEEAAQRAISLLHGKQLRGRPLRVNEAENRPPRPAGGGPGARPTGGGGPYGGGYGQRPSYGPRGGGPGLPPGPPPDFGNEFGRRTDGRPPRRFTTKEKGPRRPEPRRRRDDFDDE